MQMAIASKLNSFNEFVVAIISYCYPSLMVLWPISVRSPSHILFVNWYRFNVSTGTGWRKLNCCMTRTTCWISMVAKHMSGTTIWLIWDTSPTMRDIELIV